MSRRARVMFLEGPGDLLGTLQHWLQGHDDPRIPHVAFSGQIFDLCRELDLEAWVIGTNTSAGLVRHGHLTAEHRPDPSLGKSGAAYHAAQLQMAASYYASIAQLRPDLVFACMPSHLFLLGPLRLLGVPWVAVYHNMLLTRGDTGRLRRAIKALDSLVVGSAATSIMCVTSDIREQLQALGAPRRAPFVDFLPAFRPELFATVPPASPHAPFVVTFVGRVVKDKGVFDILAVAKQLALVGRDDIRFEICGSGDDLDRLRSEVAQAGLSERFVLHGWCDQEAVARVYARTSVAFVPTTVSFTEGFCMVVIEALLAGRPVITSDVVPAARYVPDTATIVRAGDIAGYGAAILRLADDRSELSRRQARARASTGRFLDVNQSYYGAMRHILGAVQRGQRPAAITINP